MIYKFVWEEDTRLVRGHLIAIFTKIEKRLKIIVLDHPKGWEWKSSSKLIKLVKIDWLMKRPGVEFEDTSD